jgi:GT2 family glycosyltransferase
MTGFGLERIDGIAPQPHPTSRRLRVAIGIATAGRPATVKQLLVALGLQSRKPDAIVVCAPTLADIAGIADRYPEVRLITGVRGLTSQRNEILHHLEGLDVVFFIDDDFIPGRRYLECSEAIFVASPEIVMTTGWVIADGILGPGLQFAAAQDLLRNGEAELGQHPLTQETYNAYGCNMGVRLATVREHGITFDTGLPLYGWLEDIDFSRRMARHGLIVKVFGACGVHLGIKTGRQSGVRLGYSQIANPIYLVRKGTCSPQRAMFLMTRNIAANLIKILRPEAYIDRRGRAAGNWRALFDLISGRLAPSRVLTL